MVASGAVTTAPLATITKMGEAPHALRNHARKKPEE